MQAAHVSTHLIRQNPHFHVVFITCLKSLQFTSCLHKITGKKAKKGLNRAFI